MAEVEIEPLARKAQADLIVERAAEQLRRIVHELVDQLQPFPPFPGAFFTNAIEIEPDAAASNERGCVVLAPDGELYELIMGVEFDTPEALMDPVAARKEELRKLDLHPRDYVVFAYNAITALTERLLEQSEQGEAGR